MDRAYLIKSDGNRLAYVYTPAQGEGLRLPCVMFLGGFKSDMTGTKALFLEEYCRARGFGFVRFDYSGHGVSDGAFEDGTISAWTQDAQGILENIVHQDVLLIGSSMGGWIALRLLLQFSRRVRGVIGIAAAPDFTQEILPRMSAVQKDMMTQEGKISVPSAYGEPYIYTHALIEDGQKNLLLDRVHKINVPMILLQGQQDDAVPWQTALKIKDRFQGPYTEVILIEDGDHRLSRPADLEKLKEALEKVLAFA